MGKLKSIGLYLKYLIHDIGYLIKYTVSYIGYMILIVVLPGLTVFTLGLLFYFGFLLVGWYVAFTLMFPKHSERFIENMLNSYTDSE